ncbi:MAG: hypothetical protein ACLUMK_04910 [Christensenellales bacterium]
MSTATKPGRAGGERRFAASARQDVAQACAFLPDAASFITRQVLGVDGGYI